jgi:hypothetical protein
VSPGTTALELVGGFAGLRCWALDRLLAGATTRTFRRDQVIAWLRRREEAVAAAQPSLAETILNDRRWSSSRRPRLDRLHAVRDLCDEIGTALAARDRDRRPRGLRKELAAIRALLAEARTRQTTGVEATDEEGARRSQRPPRDRTRCEGVSSAIEPTE